MEESKDNSVQEEDNARIEDVKDDASDPESFDSIQKEPLADKATPNKDDSCTEIQITGEQKQCLELVKLSLDEAKINIVQLIVDRIVVGKTENGAEFEVITIPELVSLLFPLCKARVKSQKALTDTFKALAPGPEDFILVQDLVEIFEESGDDFLLEGMSELDEEAVETMAGVLQWLQESNGNIGDLFKEATYEQTVGAGEESVVMELIDAKDFYGALYRLRVADRENKSLSEFLCVAKEHPNVFLVKKIIKLLEHIAMQIEQQEYNDN
eukprot:TRINITY_DN3707_c0_g1_i6.p2 TRINITY_DN3707_c0_g1~~TRINITY_DN3707_c0_g1_i6.p2  ORF type:complete len:269 (+),score=85.05 TRINITY_DN3707_c0_g1_i6:861-1667(+)